MSNARVQPVRKITAKRFRVSRARTGLGLFATARIEKGARIVEYTGPRIPTPEAKAREHKHSSRYMFRIDRAKTIDGSPRTNQARYANHACRPNARAVLTGNRIHLHARRMIQPGEEITYNYGREYFDFFFRDSGCRCTTCLQRPDKARR